MSRSLLQQLFFFLFAVLALSSCQGIKQRSTAETASYQLQGLPAHCLPLIDAFRTIVASEGVANASSAPLPAFPLLHSNRFLHDLSQFAILPAETQEWTSLAAKLAIQTRASENANLNSPWSELDLERLAACSENLAENSTQQQLRTSIIAALQFSPFPDHYLRGRQTLGALFLLRPLLKQRILAAHADEQNWYRQTENFALSSFYELEPDPVNEAEISNLEIADWMQKAYASSALALPLLPDKQLNLLFRKHAPKFHIDLLQDNDKLGAPHWQQNQIAVDTENPHIYTIASMTRFADTKLLQLNYVAWFPERRPTAPIDLYAGKIDSIIWRVTLNKDGEVLLYDSIHSCGCYHKYFPVSQQLLVRTSPTAREPANIFPLSHSIAERGVTLTITSNEHYIVGVSSTIPAANSQQQLQTSRYRFQPYHSLYNLQHNFQSNSPNPSASKSLFDADGIISASKRLERFTLWPTGIRSVGAMRQWGTHSTGFIEQQHFDDANLLENYFQLSP